MVWARPKPASFADLRAVTGDELRALVEKSPDIGARLVESAAKYGLVTAQLTWARMLLEGRGVPKDEAAACRWFVIAAESGDLEAVNMVGRCHELGWGVPVDKAAASEHYRRAARQNFAWAQYNLGQLLLAGEPTPAQRREGLGWHLVAAKAGHAKSMTVVGRFCEEGWEMQRNPGNAMGWFRKAAEGGDYWGQFNLGRLLSDEGQTVEAVKWLRKAAETGNDEFVESIIPALRDHYDPAIQDLAREIVARRKHAKRQAEAGEAPRPAPVKKSKGWFRRIPAGEPVS